MGTPRLTLALATPSRYPLLLLLVAVTLTLTLLTGCPPPPPSERDIVVDAFLDLETPWDLNRDLLFFLGSRTLDFKLTFTVSGAGAGDTVKLYLIGGNEPIAETRRGKVTTDKTAGNVVVFRVSRTSRDHNIKVKLDKISVTRDNGFFAVPGSETVPMGPSVPAIPLALNQPLFLPFSYAYEERYFASVSGLAPVAGDESPKRVVMLDQAAQTLIGLPTTGYVLPTWSGKWDEYNSDAQNPAKLLAVPGGVDRMLFSIIIPAQAGSGIARFVVTDKMMTQTLDYSRANAAGARFANNQDSIALPAGLCTIGQDSTSNARGMTVPDAVEGMEPDQDGVLFGLGCRIGAKASPEAYRFFELKNGWTVSSVKTRYSIDGHQWFDSETDAEKDWAGSPLADGDLGQFADRQGFSFLAQPARGSVAPFVQARVWNDPPTPPSRARSLWATVQITIDGPVGTDPYVGRPAFPPLTECREGFYRVDHNGERVCVEFQDSSLFDQPLVLSSACVTAGDCESSYVCANLGGERDACVKGYKLEN